MRKERRSKYHMIKDILVLLNEYPKIKLNRLILKSNMTYKTLLAYISILKDKKLVTKEGQRFTVTEKGFNYIKLYKVFEEIVYG